MFVDAVISSSEDRSVGCVGNGIALVKVANAAPAPRKGKREGLSRSRRGNLQIMGWPRCLNVQPRVVCPCMTGKLRNGAVDKRIACKNNGPKLSRVKAQRSILECWDTRLLCHRAIAYSPPGVRVVVSPPLSVTPLLLSLKDSGELNTQPEHTINGPNLDVFSRLSCPHHPVWETLRPMA